MTEYRSRRRIGSVGSRRKGRAPIADVPLADTVSTDFDAVREGPRQAGWRADKPATLSWLEALDKGNPRAEAAQRDRIVMLAAPFTGEPVQLATTAFRSDSISGAATSSRSSRSHGGRRGGRARGGCDPARRRARRI